MRVAAAPHPLSQRTATPTAQGFEDAKPHVGCKSYILKILGLQTGISACLRRFYMGCVGGMLKL